VRHYRREQRIQANPNSDSTKLKFEVATLENKLEIQSRRAAATAGGAAVTNQRIEISKLQGRSNRHSGN
jgi:hypothetical protein